MADSKLVDLTAVTALEAADVLYVVDDPGGTPLSRKVTVANLHLSINASTPDANVTGALGVLDVVTMSSMTADRDYTLPTTAAVGDRCGVAVVDGDDTYELLIKSGAAGDKINNVDHSTNEWSRLFIAGERVTFVCIDAAGPHWLVENDGRIPCTARVTRDAAQSITHASATAVSWDNEDFDVGAIAATSTTQVTLRRNGRYKFSWQIRMADLFEFIEQASGSLSINGTAVISVVQFCYAGTNRAIGSAAGSVLTNLTAGDYAEVEIYQNEGGSVNTTTGTYKPFLSVHEII